MSKKNPFKAYTPSGEVRPCPPEHGCPKYRKGYDRDAYRVHVCDGQVHNYGGQPKDEGWWTYNWRCMELSEIEAAEFTKKNSHPNVRKVVGDTLAKAGWRGPLNSGEVRCIRALLKELGYADNVIRSWTVDRPYSNTYYSLLRGPFWLFKSPVDGVDMNDFIKLARMYKDDKKNGALKKAIIELMKRPVEEIRQEIKTFGVLDKLAGLKVA